MTVRFVSTHAFTDILVSGKRTEHSRARAHKPHRSRPVHQIAATTGISTVCPFFCHWKPTSAPCTYVARYKARANTPKRGAKNTTQYKTRKTNDHGIFRLPVEGIRFARPPCSWRTLRASGVFAIPSPSSVPWELGPERRREWSPYPPVACPRHAPPLPLDLDFELVHSCSSPYFPPGLKKTLLPHEHSK